EDVAAANERADREEARRAWFVMGSIDDVVQAYLSQARNAPATASRGVDSVGEGEIAEIGQALEARGLRGATDAALTGVLGQLAAMRDASLRALVLARGAIGAAMRELARRKWAIL